MIDVYFNFILNAFAWQLEESVVKEFDSMVESNNIILHGSGDDELDSLATYLEKWRIKLWDKGYSSFFKGPNQFLRSKAFLEHDGVELAMKRLLYRYFYISNVNVQCNQMKLQFKFICF